MNKHILKRISALSIMMLAFVVFASAQNKDVEKGKETLKKALTQTDAMKKQDGITKAREYFTKGGLKPQEAAVLLGEAYLEAGDLKNASTAYNTAGKEDKKEGLRKVADAYVEQAFGGEDAKAQTKSLNEAMKLYGKADALKEGARGIGDRFYEQGPDSYEKALGYYLQGDASVKIEQIAKEYMEKGGDNEGKAAEVYLKMKSKDGYTKAGDIYYNRKEYGKAIDAYLAGGISAGIQKYADYLYSENRGEEADNLILKLGDALAEKKDDEGQEELAKKVMGKGSYALAAKLYDKAGNLAMKDKSLAYDALINFRLEEAKGLFLGIPDPASAQMITDNEKALAPLKDIAESFDEMKKNAPYVSLIVDSVSGTSYPSPGDQKMVDDYYKSISGQIYTNVTAVATNFAKLTNAELKKYIKQSFLRYGAIRNILDKETFTVRKQKSEVKAKDVAL